MKTRLMTIVTLIALVFAINTKADNVERDVPSFSEISLRVPAKLHVEQGKTQSVEIVAKSSTLEELITEVKGRELIIRFSAKNYLWKDFTPGKIEIFITVPEVNALSVSGSGDIINDGPIETRILDLAVSGSGDILLDDLKAERVKASISGSGNIRISGNGTAEDLSVNSSGSGNFKGIDFNAQDVKVKLAGSGNAEVSAVKNLNVRAAGSGNVTYKGNPLIDQSVVGSGRVKAY